MNKSEAINSRDYWDSRFTKDWTALRGNEQSRFFAHLICQNLPHWLTRRLQNRQTKICDWGCAEGDGSALIAEFLGIENLVGIDFSAEAIERARVTFPTYEFHAENWLEAPPSPCSYDTIFSSNTLEHFHEPFIALNCLFAAAREHVVLLIPFLEFERHEEHFFTFTSQNVPFAGSEQFILTHSNVLDLREPPNPFWDGYQVLLVYTRVSIAARERLCLDQVKIRDESTSSWTRLEEILQKQIARSEELACLKNALEENLRRRANDIITLQEENATLRQQVSQMEIQLRDVYQSRSWRTTRWLRQTNSILRSYLSRYFN